MFLHSLQLTNLLSFGPEPIQIELKPLNVIIGPNGSGKSNLIEAIALLQCAPTQLVAPVREGGGIKDWLWKGASNGPIASIEAIIDYPFRALGIPLRHRLSFTESGQRFELVDEKIEDQVPVKENEKQPKFFYKFQNGRPVLSIKDVEGPRQLQREEVNPELSILSQRKDPDHYPELTYLGEQYAKIAIYREWSFGRYTPPRLPQKADLRNDVLMENCINLGLVLNRFQKEPLVKKKILEGIKELYEGIDDFEVIFEGGTVQLFLTEGKFSIPATRLSDGTLRYLCLLAILCHPNPPPLVCLEEPELGLHPDAIAKIADLLKNYSQTSQIIVTTHSDALVDALTDTPESVLVCEKHDGMTKLERLRKEKLADWLKKYSLGQLWQRGEIGGNRW